MPSVFKRFSTLVNRDKDKDKDKKDKRKSLGSVLGSTPSKTKKEEKPAPLKSEGKRIVVVSGASVGLGIELVKRFSSEPGTFVIALDSGSPSSALKALLKDHVVAVQVPSVLEKDMSKAVGEITKLSGGRIDILVNAAVPPKHSQKTLSEILHYDIGQELSDMVATPIAITNALLPYLKKYVPPPAPTPVEPTVAATTASEPPAAKDSATPTTGTASKDNVVSPPATTAANDTPLTSSEKPNTTDAAASSTAPSPTENGAPSQVHETTSAPVPSEANSADKNPESKPHEYSEGPNNAATHSVNVSPPSTGITNSAGEPVSKNELLVQKFLSDDLQDPALAPHVEGRLFGKEAKDAEAAKAEGRETKFEEREVKNVKEGTSLVTEEHVTPSNKVAGQDSSADGAAVSGAPEGATTTTAATAPTTKATEADNANGPTAAPTMEINGAPASTAVVAVAKPAEPVKPSFPANPIVAFITTTRPVHSVFPPVPYATQSMAHAALHVAVGKYSHDLAARGIVVIGIEEAGWNEADSLHTSDDATNHVMKQIEDCGLSHNGKILRHDTSGPAVYDWASLKPNALF